MSRFRRVLSQMAWWSPGSAQHQALLQAEIDEHIALQTADNVRAGLSPSEARRQALLKFGGVVSVREAYRDQREPRFWRAIKDFGRDLQYAGRTLARARAFTFVCVVSLGIGMAPVMAVPYVSRLLDVAAPHVNGAGLVEVVTTRVGPREATSEWSYPDFVDLREASTGAALVGWTAAQTDILFSGGAKTNAKVMYVSASYFKVIGVPLAAGGGFDDAMDDPIRSQPVVVVGYRFWQHRLGADPQAIGTTLALNGAPHLIVGIAPDRFEGHLAFMSAELFVPLEQHPLLVSTPDIRSDRARRWVYIHGRLEPGVSVAQASAAVSSVTSRLAAEYKATNEFTAGVAAPYDSWGTLDRSQFRRLRIVAFTLTGMVLIVVSLNISGMMQVRSAMRERELSIRQAIGATRARLAQHLLAEALLLASAGGILAAVVLFNLPRTVAWLNNQRIPAEVQEALNVDPWMVVVCIALCVAASLVFGWLPAMRFSRPVIISALKDEAGAGGLRVGRVHRVTAALQVAIAVPLLVMGGISLDRVRTTATTPLGFDAALLYAAPLTLDGLAAEDASFKVRSLSQTLASANGVANVTVADGLPLDFRGRTTRVALQTGPEIAPRAVVAQVTRVGDHYLDTLGIPLLRGRAFSSADSAGSEPVTIISESLAKALFAGDSAVEPIGRQVTFGVAGAGDVAPRTLTIIGVTSDFPTWQMTSAREQLLLPLAQYGDVHNAVRVQTDFNSAPRLLLIARGRPGEQPETLVAAVEQVARDLDPDFQRSRVITGTSLRDNSVRDFLTQTMVAAGAGGVMLLLSSLGIYGVVGLMVAARTRELAVRVALGATRRQLLTMIVIDVVRIVTPGIAVGLLLTVTLIRLNSENMGIPLSGVERVAYLEGAAIAVLVAIAASLVPARRAASVPAMVAMRSV